MQMDANGCNCLACDCSNTLHFASLVFYVRSLFHLQLTGRGADPGPALIGQAAVLGGLVSNLAGLACARGIGLNLLANKGRAGDWGRVSPPDRHTLAKQSMLATLDAVNARISDPIRLRERVPIIAAEKKKRSAFCHTCLAESMAVQPDGGIFLDYFDLCNELGGYISSGSKSLSGSNSVHPNCA